MGDTATTDQQTSSESPPVPAVPAGGGTPNLDALAAAVADAERSGKSKATGDLLKATGFEKLTDLQAFVKDAKAAEDAKKDELTKAQEAAAQAKADADRARAEADELRHNTRIERALTVKGAPAQHVDRLRRLVDVEADATDDDVAKAVDKLTADFPALFEPVKADDKQQAPSGVTGAQAPQGGQGTVSPIAAGRERYYREHPEARPKSA